MPQPSEAELLAEWEQAAVSGRLLLQRCMNCGVFQAYVRVVCASCQSPSVRFVEASGRGEIESFTWVHRAAFEDAPVPYAVARVCLEEGPLLLSAVVDADEGELVCGDKVRLAWRDGIDGRRVPVFAPVELRKPRKETGT